MAEVTKQPKPWDVDGSRRQKIEAASAAKAAQEARLRQLYDMKQADLDDWDRLGGGGRFAGMERDAVKRMYDPQINAVKAEVDKYSMAAQGLNPDGSPIRPEFYSLLDPETGRLLQEYVLENGQIDPEKLADYQAFRKEATRTGPSEWAKLMQAQQAIAKDSAMDEAARQAGSSQALAQSQLAMRGGLSSGARERVARDAANNLLGKRQEIGRGMNASNLQMLTEDEKNRMGLFERLPGMEVGIQEFNIGQKSKQDQYNISNALEEKRARDTQDLAVYQEQLKKYGADRQAAATAQSNSGGGGK